MKKCPQCNTVYGDEVAFCLKDGAALIEETFSLPSTSDSIEEETVIRHEPIIVDFGASAETLRQTTYQVPPTPENITIIPVKTTSNTGRYALFFTLGLLIGGGLVLATILLSRTIYQNENTNLVKTSQAEKSAKTIPTAESKNENKVNETISSKHDEATSTSDEDFNGRVIVTNARVRSSPSADSSAVETLPMNDRLSIISRENPNSPWYEIECEHGTSGWMHGNTIEFTK